MEKPDAEVFDVPGATVEVTPAEAPTPKPKAAKPKKEISNERKQQLLEQLKRGRETAAKNRAAKKAAKGKPPKEADAPAPAEPPTQKPTPPKDNHSSALTEEMKLLRAELAQTRKEKREWQAAKKLAREEAKAQAAPPPAAAPKPVAEPAAEPAPTRVAPPAVQYYWDARTGKRVARR